MATLPHELRILADRLTGDDARLLWRAATQLELLYASLGADPVTLQIGPAIDCKSTLQDARREGERAQLKRALGLARGNKAAAARLLKISRVSLYKSLWKHGLQYKSDRKDTNHAG
jgi:DNA-binding NtrC family response regulator